MRFGETAMGFNLWDALSDAKDALFVSGQMALAKGEAKKKAAAFALKGASEEFDQLWGLMVLAIHDRDMREQAFADTVSRAAGIDMPLASDALILRGEAAVEFIICHGHQFDTSCTPKFAEELGELLTQAGAWAIQGPDRAWRIGFDPIDGWLEGRQNFNNTLVTDKPAGAHRPDLPLGIEIPKDAKKVALGVGKLIGALDQPWQWESLMGKNVAWEYFAHSDPTTAIKQEVETGDRWFKFRHLNEIGIVDGLRAAFVGTRVPTLVLGHSHEPRFRSTFPGRSGASALADCYLNSASAGRFQNMIWGLELIDGEPFLITWHQGDAKVGNQPVRTIWGDVAADGKTWLRPRSSAPLDELPKPVEDDARVRLARLIAVEHAL